mgnify:CR=1 FL=1
MDHFQSEYIYEREKALRMMLKLKENMDRIIARAEVSDEVDDKVAGMACSFILADSYYKKGIEKGDGWKPSLN